MQPACLKTSSAAVGTPVVIGWLTKRADYLALQGSSAKRWSTPFFTMQIRPQPADALCAYRVGFTTSRKVGNAVVRNRVRRRLRELVRRDLAACMQSGFDIVLIGRTAAAVAPFGLLQEHLREAARRLKVGKTDV